MPYYYPSTGGTRSAAYIHVVPGYPWWGGTRSAAFYIRALLLSLRGGTRTAAYFVSSEPKCQTASAVNVHEQLAQPDTLAVNVREQLA